MTMESAIKEHWCIHHNKMVVQKERTELMEAARTMIQGFNKNLWAEAVITAAYVLNRTGTSSIKDKTPYQLWFNKDF